MGQRALEGLEPFAVRLQWVEGRVRPGRSRSRRHASPKGCRPTGRGTARAEGVEIVRCCLLGRAELLEPCVDVIGLPDDVDSITVTIVGGIHAEALPVHDLDSSR